MIIKQSSTILLKFFVDDRSRFIMKDEREIESVIVENVTNEFDGICDEDGTIHFLIQSCDGSLVYIKYDSGQWKKYIVFKSKSQKAKISEISLTWDKNILCGFYTIEHNGQSLFIKHIFSSSNLYATPEVIDTLDTRKRYSVCTNHKNKTLLFYRNNEGEFIEKTLGRMFTNESERILNTDKEMFDFCSVCNGTKVITIYGALRKNYTALIFTDWNGEEKIITFAIDKKCKPSVFAMGNYILVQWLENGCVTECVSRDGGKSFSRPKTKLKQKTRNSYRKKGLRPGMYFSGETAVGNADLNYFEGLIADNFEAIKNSERENDMTQDFSKPNDNKVFRDIYPHGFEAKLSKIEKAIEKIGRDTSNICIFLDELVKFKHDTLAENQANGNKEHTENKAMNIEASSTDIGTENTENIKLFESLEIDDILSGSLIPPGGGENDDKQ